MNGLRSSSSNTNNYNNNDTTMGDAFRQRRSAKQTTGGPATPGGAGAGVGVIRQDNNTNNNRRDVTAGTTTTRTTAAAGVTESSSSSKSTPTTFQSGSGVGGVSNVPSRPPSFRDIQAEQERLSRIVVSPTTKQHPSQRRSDSSSSDFGSRRMRDDTAYNNNNNNNNNFYSHSGSSGLSAAATASSSSARKQRDNRDDRSDSLPLEQGRICSLKDAFGFIYCADREEEVFFHFSEFKVSPHHHRQTRPQDLRIDDEVEFRIGTDRNNSDKLRALQVQKLDAGTIVWDIEDDPGVRYQGVVERPVRTDRNGTVQQEGCIRILEKPIAQLNQADNNDNEVEDLAATVAGPVIYFTLNDYQANAKDMLVETRKGNSNTPSTSRGGGSGGGGGGGSGSNRLGIHDLVEFTLVTSRRTKNKYARSIHLLQSNRERQLLLKEAELLANATIEQGIVVSLKSDFGFLRSNRRREEVYFHYSNVELTDDDDDEQELKLGNEMQFLVITEEAGGNGRKEKCSARQVKFLPPGTVKFETILSEGVTGVVTRCPPTADSGYSSSDTTGLVRLIEPIKDMDDEGNERLVHEIELYASDSPGGLCPLREGVTGLWIREGDTLLFDIAKQTVDASLRVSPTKKQVGDGTAEEGEAPSVKLVSCALALRQEGTVQVTKEQFGFINLAERATESYFRLQDVFPKDIQRTLLFGMGIDCQQDLEMVAGAEVQFDLSIQRDGNKSKNRNQRGGGNQESLKGQRLLLLPPGTIAPLVKVISEQVPGVVEKDDAKQPYAGSIVLDEELLGMTFEERHPLATKLIRSLLASKELGRKSFIFPDVQSIKEDDVVKTGVQSLSNGLLRCSNLPTAGQGKNSGRLCITWAENESEKQKEGESAVEEPDSSANPNELDQNKEDADGKSGNSPSKQSKTKKKASTPKSIKTVRYDKQCLAKEFQDEQPPRVGDKVTCDVVQSRRTGTILLRDIHIVDRKDPDGQDVAPSEGNETGIGIVSEVVAARQFGFISLLDELASKREVLFFHLNSVISDNGKGLVKKGDEAKFTIATQKGGKRMAVNVEIVPRGTLDIPTKAAKNACEGFVLMEPSHSSLKDTPNPTSVSPVRGAVTSKQGGNGAGRWSNVDLNDGKKRNVMAKEEGSILLIKDPSNMFGASRKTEQGLSSQESAESDTIGGQNEEDKHTVEALPECALCTHLPYKQGSIAIHGAGATSVADASVKGPRRGDLVSFVKAKTGRGVRDVRVVSKGAATLIRGHLVQIVVDLNSPRLGTAVFIAATDKEEAYSIGLDEVISCEVTVLKDQEPVEGLLHDGNIFGVCRTKDLFLESKLGSSHKMRTKLNLTVKKGLGGKIMAQSMMAKGPDGTVGFTHGWTTRISKYAEA